jgi:hypothetical protein
VRTTVIGVMPEWFDFAYHEDIWRPLPQGLEPESRKVPGWAFGRLREQRSDAFHTTIAEQLLVYAAGGAVGSGSGTVETLVRARQVVRGMSAPSWSALIAGIVRAARE